MTLDNKTQLDNTARLHQMKINTRLTALQSALELMKINGYLGVEGAKTDDDGKVTPAWVRRSGAVDHVTLLAMAGDIEAYILGGLEEEAKAAMEAASKPKPSIIQVRP